MVAEKSYRLESLQPDRDGGNRNLACAVAEFVRTAFSQESVLMTIERVDGEFIEGRKEK
jgi:hypothetical protein